MPLTALQFHSGSFCQIGMQPQFICISLVPNTILYIVFLFKLQQRESHCVGTRRICKPRFYLLWQTRLVPLPIQTDLAQNWYQASQSQPVIESEAGLIR